MIVIAGLQSIEWHINEGTGIPPLCYLFLLMSALWCYMVAKTDRYEMQKALRVMEEWLDKLFMKQKK